MDKRIYPYVAEIIDHVIEMSDEVPSKDLIIEEIFTSPVADTTKGAMEIVNKYFQSISEVEAIATQYNRSLGYSDPVDEDLTTLVKLALMAIAEEILDSITSLDRYEGEFSQEPHLSEIRRDVWIEARRLAKMWP